MDAAEATPDDLQAQVRAVELVQRLPASTEQSRAYWKPRLAGALDRAEKRADTCKDLRFLALERSNLGDDAGVVRLWRSLDVKGCVRPVDFSIVTYGLVPAHKRQGACASLVALAKATWPRATYQDQSAIIVSVAQCSTPPDLEANLAFVPPERIAHFRSDDALSELRFRAKQAQERDADARRDALHKLESSCLESCGRLYDACVRACSGDCTPCGRSQQACNNGCSTER